MNAIFGFIAGYWWFWLIAAICSFGLFYSNIGLLAAIKARMRELGAMSDDDREKITTQDTLDAATRRARETHAKLAPSAITDLAYIATRVFGPLFIASIVLKAFGY